MKKIILYSYLKCSTCRKAVKWLESKDFKAASQLVSELQQNFQTQSINFTVSDEQRKKVENELMIEASKNFQQRAQAITQAWNKAQYNLVSLNLNTSNYFPQPMMRGGVAKFAMAEAAPAQDMAHRASAQDMDRPRCKSSLHPLRMPHAATRVAYCMRAPAAALHAPIFVDQADVQLLRRRIHHDHPSAA